MKNAAIANFLNTPVEATPENTPEDELTKEQFEELTAQIDAIRTKITTGKETSLEDARLIVVYFRARRKKYFTVQKPKEKKAVKEKTSVPKKRITKKQIADMDALDLLKDL